MKIPVKPRKPGLAAGSYPARCIAVVDLGVQPGGRFDPRPQIWISFELPTEIMEGRDGPYCRTMGRKFTRSMHQKAGLRKFIESWVGMFATDAAASEFDLKELLDKTGIATVTQNLGSDGVTYSNLTAMAPPLKSQKLEEFPPREHDLLFFDTSAPDPNALAELPQWLRNLIVDRLSDDGEVKHVSPAPVKETKEPATVDFDDDIPF